MLPCLITMLVLIIVVLTVFPYVFSYVFRLMTINKMPTIEHSLGIIQANGASE